VSQLGVASSEVCPPYPCSTAPLSNGLSPALNLGGGGSALHTCAIMLDGSARCWGSNLRGQIGNGTTTAATTPQQVFSFGTSPNSDGDGCTDVQELGGSAALGGLRDPKNFWDFFDTPGPGNVRDGSITAGDLARVVGRFGTNGDGDLDPLAAPAPTGYHTAFDRTPSTPNVWNLAPPNGSVTAQDVALIVGQFGHSCA
jgi:hypothetical protein